MGNKHGVTATDTMEFIYKHELPLGAKVTYANFVCDERPLKEEKFRVRLVVGGDKLTYEEDAGSPAASILETKLLINSVISEAKNGACFLSINLKDFFLASPMKNLKFMRIPLKYIPDDIIDMYNLQNKIHNDFDYVRIKNGMYGLKQAAILAYEHLIYNFKPYGYTPIPHTLRLWKHESHPITFCLFVGNFGVKYYNKKDVEHLISSLSNNYKHSIYWTGRNFCGMSFDWHCQQGYVDVSIPKYVPKVLEQFNHQHTINQYSPFHLDPWKPSKSGKRQFATTDDTLPLLDKKGTQRVQSNMSAQSYTLLELLIVPFCLHSIQWHNVKPTHLNSRNHNVTESLIAWPPILMMLSFATMLATCN